MKNLIIILILIFATLSLLESCTGNQVSTQSNNSAETQENTANKPEINYLATGKELALQTKSSLSKYLVAAIGEKGAEGAVEFCNTKAISITDSMSLALNAKIKRVSDKPRNPANAANEAELTYIKNWKDAKANGAEQKPIVTEIDGKMVGYYPIITNQMCLQCHGKVSTDINTATLKKINKLYPKDQATGYGENEIRGIFVVEMNKLNN